MDPALKVQITGLLYTLVFPVGTAAVVLFAGRRFGGADRGHLITGLAVLAGLLVAVLGGGAPQVPPGDADDWLFYGPLLAGGLALGLDAARGKAGPWPHLIGPLAAILLALVGWQIASRLVALWEDGVAGPLAGSAWVVDALLTALVVWVLVDRATDTDDDLRSGPLVLGPLALALVGAALATAMTGSARIGQLLGGAAAVVGLVGLAGFKWPFVAAGRGAVAAAMMLLASGLLFAHLFVDVPRPIAVVLLLSPLGAVVATRVAGATRNTLFGVLAGMALTGALVGAAAGLTMANEEAKAAAAEAESGDDDGTYYPY